MYNLRYTLATSKIDRFLKNKQMEDQLADYIARASDIDYGLSPKELRKLAYEMAIDNVVQLPHSWTDAELTSVEWFTTFFEMSSHVINQYARSDKPSTKQ